MLHLPHATSVFKVGVVIEFSRTGLGFLKGLQAGPIIHIQVAA